MKKTMTMKGDSIAVAMMLLLPLGAVGCTAPAPTSALTIAATATSHEPLPTIDAVKPLIVTHALAALRPEEGTVTVLVQGRPVARVDVTPMRGSDIETDPAAAAEQINSKLPRFGELLGQGAGTNSNDLLGVLDQAIQHTPAGGTILLLGSGITTTAPVDLRRAGNWIGHPEQFAARINQRDLPDATGRNIVFIGIGFGDADGRQPTAGPAARAALRTIWHGICQASGAASCTILDGPAGSGPPAGHNRVPVVSFDQIRTACVGSTTLSADIAFAPKSAVLKRAADNVLKPLAKALTSCPSGSRVNAYGHAATVPGLGDGVRLSKRRARAVLDRLVTLGVPRSVIGTAKGYGNRSHQPVDNMPGGVYNAKLARANRSVELVIMST